MAYRMDTRNISEMFFEKHFNSIGKVGNATSALSIENDIVDFYCKISNISNFIATEMSMCGYQDLIVDESAASEVFFINACLDGGLAYYTASYRDLLYQFEPGRLYFGYSRGDLPYSTNVPGQQKHSFFAFYFNRETILEYLQAFDNPALIKIVERTEKGGLLNSVPITRHQRGLLMKLAQSDYRGMVHRLYYECVATELLLSMLHAVCDNKPRPIRLSRRDHEKLHEAKHLLTQDLQNPPSIAELSKQVALNEDKLKKGFRLVFNQTVFKLLTESRMQQAYQDLFSTDMSVAEIAYQAGYENVSNFIAVFRKAYGKTPGALRKDTRKYYLL